MGEEKSNETEADSLPPEKGENLPDLPDASEAKELVALLIDKAGMNPQSISEELEHRVSSRTIYRWSKGDSVPQQKSDLEALQAIVRQRGLRG